MKNRRILFAALLTPIALVPVAIAFHPPQENPPLDPKASITASLNVPPDVAETLRKACYNCHSNETSWPWYSRLPVAGAQISHDVENGRHAMNFSEWGARRTARPNVGAAMLEAACTAIEAGEMPKFPYPLVHPEARLSNDEKQRFCEWTNQESRRLLDNKAP